MPTQALPSATVTLSVLWLLSLIHICLERRHEIVRRYNEAFSGIDGIKTPFNAADVYHAYHLYIILSDDEGGFIALHIVNAELNTTMSVVP